MDINWLIFAISAYLVMAISQLVDKALLNVAFQEVKSYVSMIGLLGIFVLILLPFGITGVSPEMMFWCVLGGVLFVLALVPFLSSLKGDEASRVIPLLGGTIPIVSLLGEAIFLGAVLRQQDIIAFILLVVGSVVLTFTKTENTKRSWSATFKAFLGGLLFAVSFVISKYVYDNNAFIEGFFWMRIGGVVAGLCLLLFKSTRRGLKDFFQQKKAIIKVGYFANLGLNGCGFVLQNIAISLASVGLVNALQGVQYIFIIIFIIAVSKFNPKILGEKISRTILVEKLTAILIIIAGVALLSL